MSLVIALLTIFLLILSIFLFPMIKIKNLKVNSYWIIALIGAILLIIFKQVDPSVIIDTLFSYSNVNPLKIVTLFISMSILSIFLDEIGFFNYIANLSCKKFGDNQYKLFISLYLLISFLTVFTSNDIIILTFTPFICYYCKNNQINPIPYLMLEFVAANTLSMLLIIGNTTNIYIATNLGIDFFTYLQNMFFPTIIVGITSFTTIFILFRKSLKVKMTPKESPIIKPNKGYLIIGLIHLFTTTILLALSSYFNLEMWVITLIAAISLLFWYFIYSIITKQNFKIAKYTLKHCPWNLICFMISMFIIVLAVKDSPTIINLKHFLLNNNPELSYAISGLIACNLMNNIPMSVLYTQLLPLDATNAIYTTIIASNLGAILTPLGSLAGIMWLNLLKSYDIKFSYKNFVSYGFIIVSICLLALFIFVY